MSRTTATIHLTRAEDADDIQVTDFTRGSKPFVSLELGGAAIFLTDLSVVDALEKALAEARTLLTQVQP